MNTLTKLIVLPVVALLVTAALPLLIVGLYIATLYAVARA